MRKIIGAFSVFLLLAGDANAWMRGKVPPPSGIVQVGGFDQSGQSFEYLNVIKSCTGIAASGGYPFPSILDANGYPTTAPATNVTACNVIVPISTVYNGSWVFKQCAGTSGTWRAQLAVPTSVSVGGSFVVGATTSTMTVDGTNPRVVFTFTSLASSGNGYTVPLVFTTAAATFTTPCMVLVREDQEALLDGGEIFNPDFLAAMRQLNPKVIRTMDWSSVNQCICSQFDYNHPLAALSYRNARWEPRIWAGGPGASGDITTGGSGSAYTAAAPTAWSVLADGAMLQGKVIDALSGNLTVSGSADNGSGAIRLTISDTTGLSNGQKIAYASGSTSNGANVWTLANVVSGTPGTADLVGSTFQSSTAGTISVATLNVGGTGAKILSVSSGAVTSNAVAANTLSTFTYDALLDTWRVNPRGIGDGSSNGQTPIQIQVALAIKLQKPIWLNVNFYYTNASISAMADYVAATMPSHISTYWEYSNEVWNSGFTQNGFSYQRGQYLGFPVTHSDGLGNPQGDSYYGLRSRQIFGYVEASYAAVGKTNYKRVLSGALYGSIDSYEKNIWKGFDLAPAGTSTGTGNAAYDTFTGSANYTASGNRPFDHADYISYATYGNGAQWASPLNGYAWAADVTTGGPLGTGLVGAADNYALGTAQGIADAFAFLDFDLTQGTRGGSPPPAADNYTLAGLLVKETAYNTKLAGYDVERAGLGLAPLKLSQYEGAMSPQVAPDAAACTTMSISSTYCGNAGLIANMAIAYKHSSNFKAVVKQGFDDFMALSNSESPSWFNIQAVGTTTTTSIWSLYEGGLYTPSYTSRDAIVEYNQ